MNGVRARRACLACSPASIWILISLVPQIDLHDRNISDMMFFYYKALSATRIQNITEPFDIGYQLIQEGHFGNRK